MCVCVCVLVRLCVCVYMCVCLYVCACVCGSNTLLLELPCIIMVLKTKAVSPILQYCFSAIAGIVCYGYYMVNKILAHL